MGEEKRRKIRRAAEEEILIRGEKLTCKEKVVSLFCESRERRR